MRSYGAAFDRFVVRLPPGSELSAGTGSTPGYVVTPVDVEDAACRAITVGRGPLEQEDRRGRSMCA